MQIDAFIGKWLGVTGGAERANYAQFINDLCSALDLPEPGVATGGVLGNYQFEGPVPGGGAGGSTGAIDLYKRGCFILEAKQSRLPAADRLQAQLFDVAQTAPQSPAGAPYDRLMRDALAQAKRYAVNLPGNHPWPPFLIVCDVGRAFEVYFDWSGNGRGYGHFPDQHSYRFELQRFADAAVQDTFRAIWIDPARIDPRARSAEVSRGIARRLADVSKWLEGTQRARTAQASDSERSLAIEETALFLMRIVFCMFAEDVGLLPKDSFSGFLEKAVANEAAFEPELRQLWGVMGRAGGERYASAIGGDVRYFNGGLFASAQTFKLSNADRGELLEAAKADWTKVEPAIFGTLLEQALTASERAKLGAHYTPRPYVERLVQATIMDVLDAEWDAIQKPSPLQGPESEEKPSPLQGRGLGVGAAHTALAIPHSPALSPEGEREKEAMLSAAHAFHARLASLRILDPACGTGNFLYVAMENLMRLEGDVIETIRQLGGHALPKVGPQQFLGLELNPRAAVIAELVLWIGWLRWRMKNDPAAAPEPVLKQFGNINFGGHAGYDAVLRRKPTGEPDTDNPMIPDWPEADFIVGNPPFIGKGSQMRNALGDDYVEALSKANQRVRKSADFVMQWWDRSANLLMSNSSLLVRFGFVTTNSITQSFNRKVLEPYLHGGAASLVMAVPDHPWTKATKDAAAVRISMTVVARGRQEGRLIKIVGEADLHTDEPKLSEQVSLGSINSDLTVGADVTLAEPLLANSGMSNTGMLLAGQGFKLSPSEAAYLTSKDGPDSIQIIKPYTGGGELMDRPKGRFIIDLFGLSESAARQKFPAAYQHVLAKVKPERDQNSQKARREKWWLFGRSNTELRAAKAGLSRFIATVETAKHRVFQFVDGTTIPDHMAITISTADAFHLGILSSRIHCEWVYATCSLLGVAKFEQGHRYNKSVCFDPFPFPDATPAQRAVIAELAEELDATRKAALAEVPKLTMTEIYNLRDRQRAGALTDLIEVERASAARVGIVNRLHEQIDAAVAAAYGWPDNLPPSEVVARLVALNAARAAEEKAGTIRWLRPEYQQPRFGPKG
ncbi:DNA methyltransferase [Novosphingobium sp.]|uniref:DNA methyltransferase n=1 Tax=Novosphingobium sp. TaxID=1874826 RepID=UPI002608177C|nr:DNA methyltransferase [Novosphingobium sp.]